MSTSILTRCAARLALAALDGLAACALAALFLWGAATPAWGYVDPSVVTYAIQAIAGVAVALSAVVGVAWRRLRRLFCRVLHIDPASKRAREPEVARIDADDRSAHEAAEKRAQEFFGTVEAACDPATRRRLSWPKRLALGFLAALSLCFTLLFVAPCEIMTAGSSELLLGTTDVWPLLGAATLAASAVWALVLSLLRGKAFDIAAGLTAAVAAAACIQAIFMNAGLPAANGRTVVWTNFAPIAAASCAVWLALLVFAIVAAIRRSAVLRRALVGACIVVLAVQAVEVAPLLGSTGTYTGEAVATEEDLFTVSPDKNTIVFCLDTMDNDLIESAKKANPGIFDEFTGFTLYEDSVGSLVPTRYALPYLLTGESPSADESYEEYVKTRYTRSSLIQTIRDQDYSVGIYTTYARDKGYLADKADNIHAIDGLHIDTVGTLKALLKASCYRDMPWLFKPKFRFYTDDLNNDLIARTGQDPANEPYLVNDSAYYEQLASTGLAASDTRGAGAFRFIHLKGAHSPFIMNQNAQRASSGTSRAKQIVGTFKIVEEYIKQLKELGVYDQTTIIVTADHGDFEHDVETLTKTTSPLLMVKPAQDAQADAEPLMVSQAKTGHMDYPATLVASVGGDASRWGTTVWEATEAPRRRFYITTDEREKKDRGFIEYEIDGPVWEISNWKKTGQTWPVASEGGK